MAKRGRKKRTKPDADKSSSGPGRPATEEESEPPPVPQWHNPGGKRQRLTDAGSSDEEMRLDIEVNVEDDIDETPPPTLQLLPVLPPQPAVTSPKMAATSGDEGMSGLMAAVPEENGFVVKSEPFDPSYEMGDLLLNGSVDSIMDMPLFNEVDSLMNIKHEDHLNDTIFYLPMSYPLDAGVKVEVDSVQVAEATRTLANELAMPNALVYVRPDGSTAGKAPFTLQAPLDIKEEAGEDGSPELRAHLKALSGAGCSEDLAENGVNGHHYDLHQQEHNGYKPAGAGKGGSRKAGKKGGPPQDRDSEANSAKKVNGVRSRQTGSHSTSSNSDSGSGEEGESSPPHVDTHLPAAVQHTLVDDRPEIDRFVICSDHTMECVLCAFTTDSYSAFKSHIICSHPCWRITKKLSKNRLLVERSIKTSSSSAFGGGFL